MIAQVWRIHPAKRLQNIKLGSFFAGEKSVWAFFSNMYILEENASTGLHRQIKSLKLALDIIQ